MFCQFEALFLEFSFKLSEERFTNVKVLEGETVIGELGESQPPRLNTLFEMGWKKGPLDRWLKLW